VTLGVYRFGRNDPRSRQLKRIQGVPRRRRRNGTTGQFGGTPQPSGASRLIINGDGSTAPRGEALASNKPFNVKGTTWELAFPGEGAAPFKVAKSNKNVAEVPRPPHHAVGQKIKPF
jgi:hypothetical protein